MTFFSSSFCSFFLFFPFQGLAHLTLNDQGMGSFLFYFGSVFFRGIDSASLPPPQPLKTATFPHNSLLCFLPFSWCHVPPFSSWTLPRLLHSFQHPPPLLPPFLLPFHISPSFLVVTTASSSLSSPPCLCTFPWPPPMCVPPPCPVLWLTSWTFTSDHLWPRRPDPGAEGNTFLLSLLLGFKQNKTKRKKKRRWKKKQKKKKNADYIGNVFAGQSYKSKMSRLSIHFNTSRWKCCRMCRVSRHHSANIPIVWH